MSLAIAYTRSVLGIESPLVTVEAHLSGGLPRFAIVGLPETAVKESRDRVRGAIIHSGYEFPKGRITVNLAPADLPKSGGRFDLAITMSVLVASGQVRAKRLDQFEFIGEVALSGALRPSGGTLPAALRARESGRTLILTWADAREAALARDAVVLFGGHVREVCAHLEGNESLSPVTPPASTPWCQERDRIEGSEHGPRSGPGHGERDVSEDAAGQEANEGSFRINRVRPATETETSDLSDVHGQHRAKRALEIAAAGAHNVVMIGPPGTGKTMLATRLSGILPPMQESECLESAAVWSVSNAGFDPARWGRRPYRAPHHTASAVALVGGGSPPRPGEISLAHQGVLFLDELPEFDRRVLEVLREPMESGRITISRAARQAEFPARFQLVAAMNPCPCGHLGDGTSRCTCSPEQVRRYRARVSGPLLDRIDLHVDVAAPATRAYPTDNESQRRDSLPVARGTPPVAAGTDEARPGALDPAARSSRAVAEIAPPSPESIPPSPGSADSESSASVRGRVAAARQRQLARRGRSNATLSARQVETDCRPSRPARKLLEAATERLALSRRGHHRVLKVARTIADIEGDDQIEENHLAESLSYRLRTL